MQPQSLQKSYPKAETTSYHSGRSAIVYISKTFQTDETGNNEYQTRLLDDIKTKTRLSSGNIQDCEEPSETVTAPSQRRHIRTPGEKDNSQSVIEKKAETIVRSQRSPKQMSTGCCFYLSAVAKRKMGRNSIHNPKQTYPCHLGSVLGPCQKHVRPSLPWVDSTRLNSSTGLFSSVSTHLLRQ